jgi:hypothetical protein
VAQNNKADGVNVTPITVVASIDPELLENLIDMEKIDADSVNNCTDESVMEFLDATQERDASVTAEFVKAIVLAKVTFAMSEKDPALRNLLSDREQTRDGQVRTQEGIPRVR